MRSAVRICLALPNYKASAVSDYSQRRGFFVSENNFQMITLIHSKRLFLQNGEFVNIPPKEENNLLFSLLETNLKKILVYIWRLSIHF